MPLDPIFSELDKAGLSPYIIKRSNVFGGCSMHLKFPNGYGASIIRHRYSMGHDQGLYELGPMEASETGSLSLAVEMPMLQDYDGSPYGYLTLESTVLLCTYILSYQHRKITPDQFYSDLLGDHNK